MTGDAPSKALKEFDTSVALMLAGMNSQTALAASRKALMAADVLKAEKDPLAAQAEELKTDLGRLYKATLAMEREPEVVKRNTLALIMNALSPLLVGYQDYISSPDKPLWKLGMEAMVAAAEVVGAYQYLESAKIISSQAYDLDLWELEQRASQLLSSREPGAKALVEGHRAMNEFFDRFRGPDFPQEQKPLASLVISLLLFILFYYRFKMAQEAK